MSRLTPFRSFFLPAFLSSLPPFRSFFLPFFPPFLPSFPGLAAFHAPNAPSPAETSRTCRTFRPKCTQSRRNVTDLSHFPPQMHLVPQKHHGPVALSVSNAPSPAEMLRTCRTFRLECPQSRRNIADLSHFPSQMHPVPQKCYGLASFSVSNAPSPAEMLRTSIILRFKCT